MPGECAVQTLAEFLRCQCELCRAIRMQLMLDYVRNMPPLADIGLPDLDVPIEPRDVAPSGGAE